MTGLWPCAALAYFSDGVYFCHESLLTRKTVMRPSDLLAVRKALGHIPIVEGEIGGAIPLFVERYMYQTKEVAVGGQPLVVLLTHFGGSTVREGDAEHLRSTVLPTQSLLIPPNTATHWHYSGTVDYAIFYLLESNDRLAVALRLLTEARQEPMSFSDPLVGAASRQLLDELQKGPGADAEFMQLLVRVLFEQSFRTLTTPAAGGINPRHVHFSRLQAVLNFIRNHLDSDLSVANLAKIAGINVSYFRRLFHDATGMAPRDYVLSVRLEQARKLLTLSELPIIQIAEECGFASQSHLTARFRTAHAVTPAQFRKQTGRQA